MPVEDRGRRRLRRALRMASRAPLRKAKGACSGGGTSPARRAKCRSLPPRAVWRTLHIDRELTEFEPLAFAPRRDPRRAPVPLSRLEIAERHVALEGELQRRGAGIEIPVARPSLSRTSRTSGRTMVKEPISIRPMMSGSRRIVPVSRSIDRISASSMPCGPPTCTSFKVTLSRGKKLDLRLAAQRHVAAGPAGDLLADPRLQRLARHQRDEQHKERGGGQQHCREDPSDALHSDELCVPQPGDRAWPRPMARLAGLALPAAMAMLRPVRTAR